MFVEDDEDTISLLADLRCIGKEVGLEFSYLDEEEWLNVPTRRDGILLGLCNYRIVYDYEIFRCSSISTKVWNVSCIFW